MKTAKTATKLPLNLTAYIEGSDLIQAAKARLEAVETQANRQIANAEWLDERATAIAAEIEAGAKSTALAWQIDTFKAESISSRALAAELATNSIPALSADVRRACSVKAEAGDRIEAVLKAANGRANLHVYSEAWEVLNVVTAAVAKLDNESVSLRQRAGAVIEATSGGKVSNSYNGSRCATRLRIRISATGKGAILECVKAVSIGNSGGKAMSIDLSERGMADWLEVRGKTFGTVKREDVTTCGGFAGGGMSDSVSALAEAAVADAFAMFPNLSVN